MVPSYNRSFGRFMPTGNAKVAGRVEEVTDPERIAAINGEGAPSGPRTSSTTSSSSPGTPAAGSSVASAANSRRTRRVSR